MAHGLPEVVLSSIGTTDTPSKPSPGGKSDASTAGTGAKTGNKLDCVTKACSGVVDAFKRMKLEMKDQGMQFPSHATANPKPLVTPEKASPLEGRATAHETNGASVFIATAAVGVAGAAAAGAAQDGTPGQTSQDSKASSSLDASSSPASTDASGTASNSSDRSLPTEAEEKALPPGTPSDRYDGYGPAADRYTADLRAFFGDDVMPSSSSADDSVEESPKPWSSYMYAACPPETTAIGRATWTFLHSMAAYYPESPSPEERQLMQTMLRGLGVFYPCQTCAEHLREVMQEEPPRASSNLALSLWLCRTHNKVNEGLMKPLFDCRRVLERWREGPADGSCD